MGIGTYNAVLDTAMTFAERAKYGGKVLVIGMCTVFLGLIILMLVLLLFKLFAYTIPNKKKSKAVTEPAQVVEEEPVEEVSNDSSNEELIAAITAAIEAFRSENDEVLPFRVVSFNRKKGASGWSSKSETDNY